MSLSTSFILHLQLFNPKPSKALPNDTTNSSNSEPTNPPSSAKNTNNEIRVCTNRTCRRRGSLQTLETLLGITPPHICVKPCGCLGRCGSGPNLVVLPHAAMVSHCGTPARAAEVLVDICGHGGGGADDVARRSLDALALRKRAEIEFQGQNFSEAETLFSLAIEAKPVGGVHIAYKGRSAVRLALGNIAEALEDAKEAIVSAPQYAEAYICQGDAFLAMDQVEGAEESYAMALESNPSLRRSQSFQARIQMLKEKMTSIAMP